MPRFSVSLLVEMIGQGRNPGVNTIGQFCREPCSAPCRLSIRLRGRDTDLLSWLCFVAHDMVSCSGYGRDIIVRRQARSVRMVGSDNPMEKPAAGGSDEASG